MKCAWRRGMRESQEGGEEVFEFFYVRAREKFSTIWRFRGHFINDGFDIIIDGTRSGIEPRLGGLRRREETVDSIKFSLNAPGVNLRHKLNFFYRVFGDIFVFNLPNKSIEISDQSP